MYANINGVNGVGLVQVSHGSRFNVDIVRKKYNEELNVQIIGKGSSSRPANLCEMFVWCIGP